MSVSCLQPDLVKKVTYHKSDNHVNPVIAGAPLDYSFRKVSSLAELEYGTPREFRVGIPKKNKSGKFVSRYIHIRECFVHHHFFITPRLPVL